MNVIAEMTIDALRERGLDPLDHYETALRLACEKHPPPFGQRYYGDTYRKLAIDPQWLAESLVANAGREGDGAGRLWSLAACTEDASVSAQVKQHALDEARHARWYVTLVDHVFPGAIDESLRPDVEALSPGYGRHDEPEPVPGSPYAYSVTVDDLVQMNIAEIRTRIHHLLQRPVLLAHCAADRHARVLPLLTRLLADETTHVAYTARLIEEHARRGGPDDIVDLMCERMNDFNEITNGEVADEVFEST